MTVWTPIGPKLSIPFLIGGPGPGEAAFGTAFAAEVFDELAPMAVEDEANGGVLAALCDAIGGMFGQVEEAVRASSGQDAGSQTFDIDRTPDFLVPFVGQSAGVRVTAGLTVAQQREEVREGKSWRRGRLDQITGAVARTLTGSAKVRYVSVSPWQLEVFTELGETPSLAATEAAGRGAKPYGIVMSFALSSVPTIDQGTRTIDASTGNIDTAILADIT